MTDDIDIDHLAGWIGRQETAQDMVTPGLLRRFRATFGNLLSADDGHAPLGLHWCLSPPAVASDELGPDGHPVRGGFLPPVPYPNRMWAGGAVSFHAPLSAGDCVQRDSRICAVTPRQGRSGPLVFVSVEHRHSVAGQLCISERHDIVYRPAGPPPPAPGPCSAMQGAFVADPVMLFRYSAMTFNGHRIHYDHPYVTGTEGYAGLVVHGPLQATLLMHTAAKALASRAIHVEYRGLAPLIAGQAARIRQQDDRLWLEKSDGQTSFEARASRLTSPQDHP
ncbi:FAS1-like dehydratase domain-containing protein [Paracoccus hibiscisoli]|uniref:Protein dehydratase n=1 Tax=Paracoccus hibiscisoli TaxID=2023261 RepID=A0A4U0QTR9_9RHOB|nr:MaoC family dehydratase N-terminal domain-containing protein [Paracoccus hibiscisoli]TJZ85491.1 protein dehydratase [Paracoccus hibiscisoli]